MKKLFDKIFYIENGTVKLSYNFIRILLQYKTPIRLWYKHIPIYNMGQYITLKLAIMENEQEKPKKPVPIKYLIKVDISNWWNVQLITRESADRIMTKKQLNRYIKRKFGKNVQLKSDKWFYKYVTVYKNDKLVMVFCKGQ